MPSPKIRSEEEANQLALKNKGLIKHMIDNCYSRAIKTNQNIDFDDAWQEAFIAMRRACEKYDPAIAKVSTYCCRAISWAIVRAIRGQRVIRVPSHSWEGANRTTCALFTDLGLAPLSDDYVVEYEQQTEVEEALSRALPRLSPRYLDVIRRRFWEGQTLTEIGEALGVCKERVRQIETMALDRLRKVILDLLRKDRECTQVKNASSRR